MNVHHDDQMEDEYMDDSDAMHDSDSSNEGIMKTMNVDNLEEVRCQYYDKFLYRLFQKQPDGSRGTDMSTDWYTEPNRGDRECQNEYISSFHNATLSSLNQIQVDLTQPVFNEASSEECPNEWWFRISSRGCRREFNSLFGSTLKNSSQHTSRRTVKQLTSLVFVYFSQKGLKQCNKSHCKTFKDSLRRVAPTCRWDTLREAVITIVACWSSSASHRHGITLCKVWDHSSVTVAEARLLGIDVRDEKRYGS
jgi:hypothetical protein